jgi:hypothetical protein
MSLIVLIEMRMKKNRVNIESILDSETLQQSHRM